MNITLMGSQISKFRKAGGLTQEDLGKAVGVSTQAVSRWENGGTPDVTLLPAIADTLGVDIDALFGREGGERADLGDLITRHAATRHRESFPADMSELIWRGVIGMATQTYGVPDVPPLDHAEFEHDGRTSLAKTVITLDSGLVMGSHARDLSFMAVYPEPERGYAAYFSSNEDYRQFFAVLAMPYSMEILCYLCSEPQRFITSAALCARLGLDSGEMDRVRAALDALVEVHTLSRSELETESGVMPAYCMERQPLIVPLLYAARLMLQEGDANYVDAFLRERPWLKKEAPNETEK